MVGKHLATSTCKSTQTTAMNGTGSTTTSTTWLNLHLANGTQATHKRSKEFRLEKLKPCRRGYMYEHISIKDEKSSNM